MQSIAKARRQTLLLASGMALAIFVSAFMPESILLIALRSPGIPFIAAHYVCYAVFSFFLSLGFKFIRMLHHIKLNDGISALCSFTVAAAWGGAIEIIQLWVPSRRADWMDLWTDLAGALTGVIVYFIFSHYLHHRKRIKQR